MVIALFRGLATLPISTHDEGPLGPFRFRTKFRVEGLGKPYKP